MALSEHILSKSKFHSAFDRVIRNSSQEQIVILVTTFICVIFCIFLDGFASSSNLIALARDVSVLGILGIGMAVVVVSRGLDLSQGATMAVSSAWVFKLINDGFPITYALILGLAMAIAFGVINGALIAYIEMPALFVTLAMGFLVAGTVRTGLLGGELIHYLPKSAENLLFMGQGRVAGIPVPVILFVIIALGTHLFLSKTSYGAFIYAHGDNENTARLTGISVRPLTILEYVLCAVIGYIAGVIMASSVGSVDLRIINSTLIFDAILVVVLGGISLSGGRGSIVSVVVGTALIGILLNGMTIMNLPGEIQNIVKGFVLLGAILIDKYLHPVDEEVVRQGDL
ncbi:MAG: ABC transporter permease [Calditrichaeota bacterium]|nr:ABC transporter permease [Calditrichota bacterium]